MTWVALALLRAHGGRRRVAALRLLGQPAAAVGCADAGGDGARLRGARPEPGGLEGPEYSSVVFELPDGKQASALYELRRLGDVEKGDTITVYEQGGEWRTTSEKAWGSTLGWGLGMVALLVMIVGWFRVRSRVKKGRSPV